MPFTIRARQTQTFKIPAGSASQPSLTFSNASSSGLFHSGGQGNVGVSVNGVERLTIHANGISVNGTITANSLVINNAATVQYTPFSMANVQITDSTFSILDDTAVSTDGGYVIINGNGFWGGTVVTVDSTPAIASSVLSYTKIGAQVPAKTAGTYAVSIVRPDALSVTLPTGLTYSPFPVWSTSSTLANVTKYTAFTQTLAATEALGSNIIYTVANGSSLPANVALSSGGVLSGNILTDPGNTTTYSFSITATDAQFQNNIPRTFGLTALQQPVFMSSTILTSTDLRTAASSLFSATTLKFRASVHGYTALAFHQQCDGFSPMFFVIKANTGYIATAYTVVPFASTGGYSAAPSGTNFLNNLWNGTTTNTTKYYNTVSPQYSINIGASYGPTFGGGHDLYISSNFTTGNNYSNPNSYTIPTATTLLGGGTFNVTELEAYI
jgi:hypothetical protein